MNNSAAEKLSLRLTGTIPTPRASAFKGAGTGCILFFIFEYASVLNGNTPRLPVAWLMMAASVIMETVLFFRIIRLLSHPRNPDTFFIFRLSFAQRAAVARTCLKNAHGSFLPFLILVLLTTAAGEFFLIGERSVLLLAVIPMASILTLLLTEALMAAQISHHVLPVTRKDTIENGAAVARKSPLRRPLATHSVTFTRNITRLFPRGIQIILMRNILYLLRGDIMITLLIMLIVPVLSAVLFLFLDDSFVPFITFLPLLLIFMSNYHYSSELSEAGELLTQCHWYHISYRQMLAGTFCTYALPALLPVFTILVLSLPALTTFAGNIRIINFIAAAAAVVFISSRMQISTRHSDNDSALSMTLFAIIAVGNFIPIAGILFSMTSAGIALLLDRRHLLKSF